jgi:glycosyltransferase involved in cell wall biosynthesis
LLVDPDDPENLARQIERLYQDRELAARLGCQARRTYQEKLTFEVFSRQFNQIFSDVIADKQNKRRTK